MADQSNRPSEAPRTWLDVPALINPIQMETDIRRYSDLGSRHINHRSKGNTQAVDMLLSDLQSIGSGRLRVRPRPFTLDGGTLQNVEATLDQSGLDGVVLVTAHLDSTADREPGFQPRLDPAPGADDNASGIAGVLAAARAILTLDQATAHREIRFVLFNAEEHEQAGSEQYAKEEKEALTDIIAVLNMDMIGFRGPGGKTFEVHAGFQNPVVEQKALDLAAEIREIAIEISELRAQVYPTQSRQEDPGENFSDHTSFAEQEYAACLISEDFFDGPKQQDPEGTPNPDYHLGEDTMANIHADYAAEIVRIVTATAWKMATQT